MNEPVSETVETTATYELEKLDKRILGDTSVSETVETTATYELEKLDKRILGDTSFDGHKLT